MNQVDFITKNALVGDSSGSRDVFLGLGYFQKMSPDAGGLFHFSQTAIQDFFARHRHHDPSQFDRTIRALKTRETNRTACIDLRYVNANANADHTLLEIRGPRNEAIPMSAILAMAPDGKGGTDMVVLYGPGVRDLNIPRVSMVDILAAAQAGERSVASHRNLQGIKRLSAAIARGFTRIPEASQNAP